MKFSVIIPTYNGGEFIETSIKSIIQQESSEFELEIIIVDDCSIDNTFEILKTLENKYKCVKIFKQDSNGGPGQARNRGIKESQGDFLFFLDDDDMFNKHTFRLVNQKLKEDQKIDTAFFNWEYDKNSSAAIHGYEGRDDLPLLKKSKDKIIESYLLNKIDCSVIYSVFNRSFIIKNNISFREGIHEDVDFMFKVLMKSNNNFAIDKILYVKNNRKGSIVNSFTPKHIDGYYGALLEMHKLLLFSNKYVDNKIFFIKGVVNVTSSRILRIFHLTEDEKVKKDMLDLLHKKLMELMNNIDNMDNFYLKEKEFKTKYEIIFEEFISYSNKDFNDFINYIDDIKDKLWSCFDLHNSVFLAPDEIRTCCKRYFYNNKFKGDVVLLKGKDESKFTYENILEKKNKLFKEINRENAPECEGCPFLTFGNWGVPLDNGVKYLSLEYHSVCNMRCTYCSDTYYGGKQAVYDVESIIDSLNEKDKLIDVPYIVWGGGEPTLDKSFVKILKLLDSNINTTKQRIITNAVKFVPELKEILDNDKGYIVTSIDAGTEEIFKKVRGIAKIDTVLENLQKYAQNKPFNVIIKYLLLEDDNNSIEELEKFVNLMKENKLLKCNFQISFDFKSEHIKEEYLIKLAYLYCLLLKEGAEFVFLDDLVWQRISLTEKEIMQKVKKYLIEKNLQEYMAQKEEFSSTIVWGTGAQAKLILNKSNFFRGVDIEYFVDPREYCIGQNFFNKEIKSPNSLSQNTKPVYIAAVQSAPLIYQQYKNLGLDSNLIIKKLVI